MIKETKKSIMPYNQLRKRLLGCFFIMKNQRKHLGDACSGVKQ